MQSLMWWVSPHMRDVDMFAKIIAVNLADSFELIKQKPDW